jgi:hypothetical protein
MPPFATTLQIPLNTGVSEVLSHCPFAGCRRCFNLLIDRKAFGFDF